MRTWPSPSIPSEEGPLVDLPVDTRTELLELALIFKAAYDEEVEPVSPPPDWR